MPVLALSASTRCAARHIATPTMNILNFREEKFRDQKSNHEIHENIVPQKFGATCVYSSVLNPKTMGRVSLGVGGRGHSPSWKLAATPPPLRMATIHMHNVTVYNVCTCTFTNFACINGKTV